MVVVFVLVRRVDEVEEAFAVVVVVVVVVCLLSVRFVGSLLLLLRVFAVVECGIVVAI